MKNTLFLAIIMIATGSLFSGYSYSDLKKDFEVGKEFFVNKFNESLSGFEYPVEVSEVSEVSEVIKNTNSADVAIFSAPTWFLHGFHGYFKRIQRPLNIKQENSMFKNSTTQKYNNFSILHPIQSLRTGTPKLRNLPILGPTFMAYLTGFAWEVFQDENKK